MQPCGLRDLARPWELLSFGLKAGRVAGCARKTLAERALKTIMQPCGLRDLARPWGRRSFGLKTKRFAGCARGTLAQRGLKNIHATLWAAGFGTSLRATVVWSQDQTSCELRPQRLSRKRHTPKPIDELGVRQATFVGVTIISLVAEDDMINQLDAK